MENFSVNPKRVRTLKCVESERTGPVVYWMQRDQRSQDNWALLFAQDLALSKDVPLIVLFNVVAKFLDATYRQYHFMLSGLLEVKKNLEEHNIPLLVSFGEPAQQIARILKELNASCLVCDFNPLRIVRSWKKELLEKIDIPCYEVDAHNIVPAFFISNKQEYGAYTLRPKMKKYMKEFLEDFPRLIKMKSSGIRQDLDLNEITKKLEIDFSVQPVEWLKPGESHARQVLEQFLNEKLERYEALRNDPTVDGTSNLSPYLHFGQISAQRVALEVLKFHDEYPSSVEAFLEELIVRKELSDNFCFYNSNYDSFEAFPNWAKETLLKHEKDERKYVYPLEELENAKTHDELWNAAQRQLTKTGKMHGYMRMYWAKKILEWTENAKVALKYAI
ncbi:deoxyribodipyrimidine photo-lyase [Pseudothermotoga hypogea]|uniref:deoxyribodipyrimidine photo-lyase n=1 Tax=Pseudothermotoga hypogea TaxID=57487 RepID=UPI0004133E3F|nr:deoxyribodipyrimidine photo-lyase [Pseudothermotoga hypogea]